MRIPLSTTAVVAVHTPYSSSTAVESRLNLKARSMAAPDAVAVQAPNLQSSTFIISRRTENTRIRGVNKNRAAIHNTCCTYTASITRKMP